MQRGFAPTVLIALSTQAIEASATLSTGLLESTLAGAFAFAERVRNPLKDATTRPAKVAEGVIWTMTTTKLKTAILLFAVGLLAIGGVLAAPNSGDDPIKPRSGAKSVAEGKSPRTVPTVRLVHPEPGGLERTSSQPCTAESAQQVELHPGVTGLLKKMDVDIGDRVKKGKCSPRSKHPRSRRRTHRQTRPCNR